MTKTTMMLIMMVFVEVHDGSDDDDDYDYSDDTECINKLFIRICLKHQYLVELHDVSLSVLSHTAVIIAHNTEFNCRLVVTVRWKPIYTWRPRLRSQTLPSSLGLELGGLRRERLLRA